MPATNYNVPCGGNFSEMCGGASSVSIFSNSPILIAQPRVPEPSALVSSYGYYSEATNSQALTNFTFSAANMTVKSCGAFCLVKNQTLWGLENAQECYCGSSLALGSVKMPNSDCNMPCTSNSSETYGAVSRLNLFGSSITPPTAYRYYKCYRQGSSLSAMAGPDQTDAQMTVAKCANFCLSASSHHFFGLDAGNHCRCGNGTKLPVSIAPAAASTECNTACGGTSGEICGGTNRVSVYGREANPPSVKVPISLWGCYTEGPAFRALDNGTS